MSFQPTLMVPGIYSISSPTLNALFTAIAKPMVESLPVIGDPASEIPHSSQKVSTRFGFTGKGT
jgi:hypothetical protein